MPKRPRLQGPTRRSRALARRVDVLENALRVIYLDCANAPMANGAAGRLVNNEIPALIEALLPGETEEDMYGRLHSAGLVGPAAEGGVSPTDPPTGGAA